MDEEVELIVEGRTRTVILVEGGAKEGTEVRIAVPSSPAPRTRMLGSESVVIDVMLVVSGSVEQKKERLFPIYCRRMTVLRLLECAD